jgi:hypothetical protein
MYNDDDDDDDVVVVVIINIRQWKVSADSGIMVHNDKKTISK